MEEYKILDGPKRGRPVEYDFDSLSEGGELLIKCKEKNRDMKLKSARSALSRRKEDGRKFTILPADIGIVIKRTA